MLCRDWLVSMLSNHVVGSREHVGWNRQTDLLGCVEIDDELKFCGSLHWQLGGFWRPSGSCRRKLPRGGKYQFHLDRTSSIHLILSLTKQTPRLSALTLG
jgi:hypothetical protein